MHVDFLTSKFADRAGETAILWKEKPYSYGHILERYTHWKTELPRLGVGPGCVAALVGDFSPECIAILLAMVENENVIVPLTGSAKADFQGKLEIAQVEKYVIVDERDLVSTKELGAKASHEFYAELRTRRAPGLVLFTSGTSGKPKGAVHDFSRLLEKFKTPRAGLKTLNFLLFDHWGGLNTLFHILSNTGCVFATKDRSPGNICRLIEQYGIEVLPASPTFLNLLLLSEEYKGRNLASLKIISYGTEPMPESTLKKLKEVFPGVRLWQTYGLIELGVLHSKSESDDSLWVKVGGDGYETRVVDGILQIKAKSAMLGYLNAPSPFTDDGWFITGDEVLQKGDYIKVLGRRSEIINVGGEKVYPAEVESVIQEMENVSEVTVFKEKNPLVGNIVCARVTLKVKEDEKEFAKKLKAFCRQRLQSFMVPVKVKVVEGDQFSDRFKKKRSSPE